MAHWPAVAAKWRFEIFHLARTEALIKTSQLVPADSRNRDSHRQLREDASSHPLHPAIACRPARTRHINEDIHSLKDFTPLKYFLERVITASGDLTLFQAREKICAARSSLR